jgi:hypothetical protein
MKKAKIPLIMVAFFLLGFIASAIWCLDAQEDLSVILMIISVAAGVGSVGAVITALVTRSTILRTAINLAISVVMSFASVIALYDWWSDSKEDIYKAVGMCMALVSLILFIWMVIFVIVAIIRTIPKSERTENFSISYVKVAFCPYCGSEIIHQDASFCALCGKKIK